MASITIYFNEVAPNEVKLCLLNACFDIFLVFHSDMVLYEHRDTHEKIAQTHKDTHDKVCKQFLCWLQYVTD